MRGRRELSAVRRKRDLSVVKLQKSCARKDLSRDRYKEKGKKAQKRLAWADEVGKVLVKVGRSIKGEKGLLLG